MHCFWPTRPGRGAARSARGLLELFTLAAILAGCGGETDPVDWIPVEQPPAGDTPVVDSGTSAMPDAMVDPMPEGSVAPTPDASDTPMPDASDPPGLDAATTPDGTVPPGDGGTPEAGSANPLDAYGLTPFETNGEPIEVADDTWTFVEFPDSSCREGSPAGIWVSLRSSSKNVMIDLEGGGACFDGISCLANPSSISSGSPPADAGLLNRSQPDNPVGDWNLVYVPYCTGDVHAGTNPSGDVPDGPQDQAFVGHLNLQKFLQRIVPTVPDAENVLLTGFSAGGFGASANAVLVQRAFPNVKVRVLDDSGPPLPADVLPSCLQQKWRDLWGLDGSILAACGDDCPNPDDFTYDYGLMLSRRFDDRTSGLIEATGDSIIRAFYGSGLDNCTGITLLTSVPAEDFENGLLQFREDLTGYDNFGTWYPDNQTHTWIASDDMYSATIGSERLVDWIADIVNGVEARHVGP